MHYVLSGCIQKILCYNARTKNMASNKTSAIKARVKVYRGERDGILFYILPPLLLGAVFAFCSMASTEKQATAPETKPSAEAPAEQE